MGIAGNGAVLASPAAPPRTGLIASSRELNRVDERTGNAGSDANPLTRWENGFAFEPENYCGGSGVADPCDGASHKTAQQSLGIVKHDPVVLYASDRCSSTDRTRDRIGRARRRLLACQSKQLAHELWTGTTAIASGMPNRYLASPASNVVTNGALSIVNGMACLEEAIGVCSCTTSVIHVSPGLMTHLQFFLNVTRMGNTFRTVNDTIVIADPGYDGSSPTGAPASTGHVWAYATDLVEVRLGPIDTYPRDNESYEGMTMTPDADNMFTYRAERLAAATFDGCCHLAAEFDIPVCADLAPS